ncbi:SDR family NAD(P)-dependent oxidoreductase [Bacteroidetes/Chlorobi group bacterium Naka2016]|jgi:short-subunit dehydrogenase|nr:MAG: SDR family NAD(P)-dependent oxidoreductase [Bacteroidetes/Chlorobi group bacterium Naka2016]
MKKILITGASRGIGRSLCKTIAKSEKCKFALIARNEDLLKQVKAEVESFGSFAEIYPCDISNKEQFQTTIHQASVYLNGVDIAILNAGISHNKWITQENYSTTFEEIYRTNVFSIAYALEVLPEIMNKSNGKIVIVSSLADVRGFPSSSAYCSSKSAVTKLAESARVELKAKGIQVITVKPGFVKTDMTAKNKFPMPFLMDVESANEIIWNGIKDNKRIVAFPLPMVLLTKFLGLVPNFIFDFFASKYKE